MTALGLILLSAVVVMSAQQVPPVVNGWREYPLRDGAIAIQPAKWRTDNIKVPVPAGKGLAIDRDGTIFVADTWNCVIRRIDARRIESELRPIQSHLNSPFARLGGAARPEQGSPSVGWDS